MDIYKHLKLTLSNDVSESATSNDSKVLKLLKDANKELEKYYDGKFKFKITDKNNETPEKLRLSPKKKRKIKEIWLTFDSELCKLQRNYNSFLQNTMDKEK